MPFRDPETGKRFNTIRDAVENYRCPGPCADCPLGQKVGGINGCVNGKWFNDHPIEAARLMGYEVIDNKEVNMDKQDSQTGLYIKYDVKKVETGEVINNCFILRPDRDPAAVAALRTYARVTPNKALADDIIAWIGAEPADKPRLEEREGSEAPGDIPTGHTDPVGATGPAGDMPTLRLAEVLGVEVGQKFVVKTSCGMSEEFVLGSDEYVRKSKDGIIADGSLLCRAINHPESVVRLPRLTEPEIERCRVYGAKWVFLNPKECFVTLCKDQPEWDETHGLWLLTSKYIDDPLGRARDTFFPSVHPGECIGLEEAAHALKNPG